MEKSVREVLYETRCHASRPYSSNYPPSHQQPSEDVKGSFLSFLSSRGLSQLKEKWNEYRHPQKPRKLISLFVSQRAERVAIAVGNQITILHKDDDYKEPCGMFTGRSLSTFTCGTWSEAHDVFGFADDTDTLYFIKANGEEIFRISKKHLKVSLPIKALITQDDSDMTKACLCTFRVLTSDGSLYDIEISQDPSASISSVRPSSSGPAVKKQFPQNVICLDYHPKTSLLAIVSSTVSISLNSSGSCSVSLWQKTTNLDLEQVSSAEFEGLYVKPKDCAGHLTSPKVQISPYGKFVATLDFRGCLVTFRLDEERLSLLKFSCGELDDAKMVSTMPTRRVQSCNDIVDFTWWSDYILTVAKRSGNVTMFDILSGDKLLENDPEYSMPILERVQQFPGHLFLLETTSHESYESSDKKEAIDLHLIDNYDQFDIAKLHWSLISFSERSVPEMFELLISSQKYQAALGVANRYGLNKDEVLKSQWTHSGQGIEEINSLLSTINDEVFVLSECVDRVGPTEDAARALLSYGLQLTNQYRFSELENDENSQAWDFRLARLKLLQSTDRLETFLGINMGRFSVQEYSKFRVMPINEAAIALAECGKIGALNLLFRRHFYSLTPFMLEILAAIPETVPVQTYGQLLPGNSPPSIIFLREDDWVECGKMVAFINRLPENYENSLIHTESIVKQCLGFSWPSTIELSIWYKNRARNIDSLSGQLDNCLALVEFACRKGISELLQYHEDISYLHQLIYSDFYDDELKLTMSLNAWEQLSDYERFKLMMKEAKEEDVAQRLLNKAIPFMQNRFHVMNQTSTDKVMDDHSAIYREADSFLVRWLKDIALENKLDICLIVIEEGCRNLQSKGFFRDEAEVVDCVLQCIYLCSVTDRWGTMASILSKVPHLQDSEAEGLKERCKIAGGHIEAGRLLAYYQVPKPINFFLDAHSDGKGVKQIFRLILSKFIRRQPGRSDIDWANMWCDLQSLQEKAFPFIDLEYILVEFCRGLLKAGKFSLAMNYLRGTGSVVLAADKAENLVIQAAREYFFSASSLACSEIWKAKECLDIFPSSRNVRAEADIIDAITLKLPNLGVNLLPVQFRQIKDPMEIIKLAITSQGGAYVNVDELIEISKLLGLRSHDDISAVQEAIAREAAVAGDLQLAFDLCLVLAKKGHGVIWDLCAALARGPALENMDLSSQKQLLGFALSHCDDESIGELLHAWTDLDMQGQCETLMTLIRTDPPKFSVHGSSIISYPLNCTQGAVDLRDWSGQVHGFHCEDPEIHLDNIKNMLSVVAKNLFAENGSSWESLLRENGKILSFAALQLPWLLQLSQKAESRKKFLPNSVSGKQYVSVRTQALMTILSWLARNGFAPRDDLISTLAKSIIEPPATTEEDIMGCSFLLNLTDAFHGVEIIEEQVRIREKYEEISSIMNVGMIYGLLHNYGVDCEGPAQRRELLLKKFQQKNTSLSSDERKKIDKAQSSFWREWKMKLEEHKRVADHSRVLEQIIPGVETAHFLAGDINYMESVVLSFIESIKFEKRKVLKDVLYLAHTYNLDCTKVLLQYLKSALVSEVWTIDNVKAEISEFKDQVLACAAEAITTITCSVYPAIDGHDKDRLAYIYGLLSDCYLKLEETKELASITDQNPTHIGTIGLGIFYKIVGQECGAISFIKGLNFKNISGLQGLNLECFSSEVYAHIDGYSVEALAKMVQTLRGVYKNQAPKGVISSESVYRHYILNLLMVLESRGKAESYCQSPENLHSLINEIEHTYHMCRKYISILSYPSRLNIIKRFFTLILPLNLTFERPSSDLTWQDCLILLLNFWIKLTDDMQEFASHEISEENFCSGCLLACLKTFASLIVKGKVSPNQGWATIVCYASYGLLCGVAVEIFYFCKAMIFCSCSFEVIADVFSETISQFPPGSTCIIENQIFLDNIQDLPHLYSSILETILQDLAGGSLEHQPLHCLLSSLSKQEDDLEDLKSVRNAVWARLAEFSNDQQLPSHVRVYALELMQFIAASGRNLKGFSAEIQSNVSPWEGWDKFQGTAGNREISGDHGVPDMTDESTRFKNTLVALKSSQLVSTISQSIEISPDDLLTMESAVSCFLRISEAASSKPHFDALLAILDEWEGLYTMGRDESNSAGTSDAGNSWSNDDWDEGWESFQVEASEKEMRKENTVSIHPLHSCWMEILKKLAMTCHFKDLLKLIDQSIVKTSGVLLDEDGAYSLSKIVLEVDYFVAFKMALLLPYEALQLSCLSVVEDKLKEIGISDTIGEDHELLVLVLSSGVISTIITRSSFGTTFSYICYMVGHFARQCQEAQLLCLRDRGTNEHENKMKKTVFLFTRILFPCFISELVKADQQILAGFLVTKFMHTNGSLSLINVAEASLQMFLERQLQVLQRDHLSLVDLKFFEPLVNTISSLRGRLANLIQTALLMLPMKAVRSGE